MRMSATTAATPRPIVRPRLYEQVAEQITVWIEESGLRVGDRFPPEREFAQMLGVSRATLSQALVALEVIGVVAVRHGDGTVLTDQGATRRVVETIRAHASRLPEVIEAREALETKLAALAAARRTDVDLACIDDALDLMEADIGRGGRGVEGDERFHAAITSAAHSSLLAKMMEELSSLIYETRIESLSQPGRPGDSLRAHRRIADAIRRGDGRAAAQAMHDHIETVSDVAILRGG